MSEKMNKQTWVLTFSIILNVILAGAFGYTYGKIEEQPFINQQNNYFHNDTNNYNYFTDYPINFYNETNNYINQTNNINVTFNLPNQTEGGYGEPTYEIVMLRGTCYNFPMWTDDGDCALEEENEIYIDNPNRRVDIYVDTDNSADSSLPDSFAIEFQFWRTDAGWYHDGVLAPTSVVAEITTDVETLVVYNTTTTEPIYVIKRTADDVRAIAWTNFYGDSFVGFGGGNLGSLTPGGLGSGTFTLYFNESDLPDYENGQGTIIENWTLSFRFSSEGQYVDMIDVNIQITFNP